MMKPERISYEPKKFTEEAKIMEPKGLSKLAGNKLAHNAFSQELMDLQMPDHRRPVPVVDSRPESKKGHDMISGEQLAKMTRESKYKLQLISSHF